LRTRFPAVDGRPVQVIEPPAPAPLPVVDLRGLPGERRETVAEALMAARTQIPFDVTRLPLICWILVRLEDEHHQLFQIEHHFVHDGWSVSILLRELQAIYEAFTDGRPSPLPELPVQYADFAAWQRRWMQGPVLERQLGYWTKQLADLPPVLELPSDRPRPQTPGLGGEVRRFPLPDELYAELRAFSRGHGSTLYMSMLAAFYALLFRYTGQRDLALGAGVANRRAPESEALIGMVVNTVVMRGDLDGDPSFRELLERVRRMTLDAYAHQDMPVERLVRELRPERVLSHNPLFQVMFSFHDSPVPALEFAGIRGHYVVHVNRSAKIDLNVVVMPRAEQRVGLGATAEPDRALVYWEYSRDMFDATTVERMIGHYLTLLRAIVADPEQRLAALPLLSAAEHRQLVGEWSATAGDYPRESSITELFERQVERSPEAVAVVAAGAREAWLTYRELNRRANHLAHSLRALGVGGPASRPEVCVGLCAERSPEMVVAILGILKAGGAYLPLDPSYPAERLAFMLEDACSPVLVAQERLMDRLAIPPALLETLRLVHPESAAPPCGRADNPPPAATADNLAYVMYTSGSTGRSKGVGVVHRGVVRLVQDASYATLDAGEVFLQFAPISFDASTLEIWGALLNGGRLVVFPPHTPSLQELGTVLLSHRVSTLWLTAGLFHQVVDDNLAALAGVRQLLAGGDVLSARHVRRVLEASPGCTVINGYGPTESTTFTSCLPMHDADDVDDPVSIGRPISGTRVYVLDRGLRPVPAGVFGELYVAGDGLAREYLRRPRLTAERFVPNSLGEAPGARLYRTGDVVRYLADGRIGFLGRRDFQVKVRGFRIELGEIEAVLAGYPGIREVVVVAPESGRVPGARELVAYLTGEPAGVRDLRSFLQQALPPAMVPAAFAFLDQMPRLPNGKLDRAALARRALPEQPVATEEFVPPRDPTEELVAGIWEEVLDRGASGRARIGVHDDFFELGGHSLLATQ
ncbi:MAG: amino acid adenylation domain-containing protein, partial [bacterium]|nr:amino acid adenylation domain-containing protein [bacterium]